MTAASTQHPQVHDLTNEDKPGDPCPAPGCGGTLIVFLSQC